MESKTIYAYSWHVDEEEQDETFIRVYGLDANNVNVCLAINGFKPHVYVELPVHVDWCLHKHKLFAFFDRVSQSKSGYSRKLVQRQKLYGAHIKIDGSVYVKKKYFYLKCCFDSRRSIRWLEKFLTPRHYISGLGSLKFALHEQDACPRLQLTSAYNLPTAGWIAFRGRRVREADGRFTEGCDEYLVQLDDKRTGRFVLEAAPSTGLAHPQPLVLSFDLEVNSEDGITMPKASRPGDTVFQISCVFSRLGSGEQDKWLLSLGDPSSEQVGATVRAFGSENALLMGFRDLVKERNPNCIIGYNIFSFDLPYLIDRALFKSIFPEWAVQGFPSERRGVQRDIKWTSSAYKNQEFKFLDCEGRLYIDLLPVVQRDFKLDNFKLDTVGAYFVGETKDNLSPKGIFKCYREGIKTGEKACRYMSICGKYCVQDSVLVMKIFEKLQLWHGLSEMAAVNNVPMLALFTKGQQIKVYSTLYKYCLENKIVVEKNGYVTRPNERYVGAFVFPPVPGLYERVIPYDFQSLYPTTIIAYNIDYTTLVTDNSIPDEMCHVMEWEDHVECKHDPKVIERKKLTSEIDYLKTRDGPTAKEQLAAARDKRKKITRSVNAMCDKRRFRFLKAGAHNEYKGVLPSVITYLLDARKRTRAEIKCLRASLATLTTPGEKEALEKTIEILNQRQLAYKVSANSMYGITGVNLNGMLSFMPVAMSITYMGRTNILKVAHLMQTKYNGTLIYADTDSNYVTFPHLQNPREMWEYAIQTAEEISKEFPDPITLEFEEAIYWLFLILTKKRYLYQTCMEDGSIKLEPGRKGVVLNRRDNCAFTRNTYEKMIKLIFDSKTRVFDVIEKSLCESIDNMFANRLPLKEFVITKSAGDYGNLKPAFFVDDKNEMKARLGQYNVPALTDEIKVAENISTPAQIDDWYLSKLPAHIQLLEKIKRRGQIKNEGSRLEYVITKTNNLKDKQANKIESFDYFSKHTDILELDYLYYMKQLINPIDQVLNVVFGRPGFIKKRHLECVRRAKQLESMYSRFDFPKCQLYLIEDSFLYSFCFKGTNQEKPKRVVCAFEVPDGLDVFNALRKKYGPLSSLKTKFDFHADTFSKRNHSEKTVLNAIRKILVV